MTKRLIAAALAMLMGAGSTFAQTLPEPRTTVTASPITDATGAGLAPFFSRDWDIGTMNGQIWGTGEYVLALMRGGNLPPLVTTSEAGTSRALAGIFGAPNTTTLFGGNTVDDRVRSGFRVTGGYWFNPEQTLGVEAGFLLIGGQTSRFSQSSTDGTILARPYFDALLNSPQAVLVAFPGLSNGSIDASARSGNFYSFNFDLTEKAFDIGWYRLYSMFGYRYYRYDEHLNVNQTISPTNPNFIPGTQVTTSDDFNTRNEFHGLDLGFRSQFMWSNFSLELLTKLAVGRVNRAVNIGGDQVISVPGAAPINQAGGVLALATNSGLTGSGDWKVLPEVGVTLNWQVRNNVSLRLGYSFLFLSSVARAGEQVDATLNPNLFPGANAALGGPARPAYNIVRSDIWMQSLNFGIQFTY